MIRAQISEVSSHEHIRVTSSQIATQNTIDPEVPVCFLPVTVTPRSTTIPTSNTIG